jgi:hypothetical protein
MHFGLLSCAGLYGERLRVSSQKKTGPDVLTREFGQAGREFKDAAPTKFIFKDSLGCIAPVMMGAIARRPRGYQSCSEPGFSLNVAERGLLSTFPANE